jgi:hypothetical protein
MSAEEMRTELETFVNKGLLEGWCGWPVKQGWRRGRMPACLRVTPIRIRNIGDEGSAALMGLSGRYRCPSLLW